jgi:hypothetical protein
MIHASLDEDRSGRTRTSGWRSSATSASGVRARSPDDWFPMVGGEEYYLSPQEALEFKLIDEIAPARSVKNPRQDRSGHRDSRQAATRTRRAARCHGVECDRSDVDEFSIVRLDGKVADRHRAGRGIGAGIALKLRRGGRARRCAARTREQVEATAAARAARAARARAGVRRHGARAARGAGRPDRARVRPRRHPRQQRRRLAAAAGAGDQRATFEQALRFNVTTAFVLTRLRFRTCSPAAAAASSTSLRAAAVCDGRVRRLRHGERRRCRS